MDRITAAGVYITILEAGSLTAAAERLDMSRSMVTRHLAQMEDWAGARLLHRSTRKLSVTAAGEQVAEQCRQLLAVVEALPTSLDSDDQAPGGLLRISCSAFLAEFALEPIIADFLADYPKAKIDFHIGNQPVNLVDERIDLALRITNDLDPNLIAKPLAKCRSKICVSPSYLAEYGAPAQLEQLSQHNCLGYAYFDKCLWQFATEGDPQAVVVSGNLSANDSQLLVNAAVAGLGIAQLPSLSVAKHLASGALVELFPEREPLPLGVYGVYRSRKHQPQILYRLLERLAEKLPKLLA